jgi:peroxin-2
LDAVELDDEIVNILKNQVINVTKFMTIGFLGRWEPEVDALLRFIIWKVCMRYG